MRRSSLLVQEKLPDHRRCRCSSLHTAEKEHQNNSLQHQERLCLAEDGVTVEGKTGRFPSALSSKEQCRVHVQHDEAQVPALHQKQDRTGAVQRDAMQGSVPQPLGFEQCFIRIKHRHRF